MITFVRDSNGMVVAAACYLVSFLIDPIIVESLEALRIL
jgi:hypothetical protein